MEIIVRNYHLPFKEPTEGHVFLDVKLPAKAQIVATTLVTGGRAQMKLVMRVRQMGEPHLTNQFLLKFSDFGDIPLPVIKPDKHDAPNSDDLQWYLWQGRRVGGDVRYDVFDVTWLEFAALRGA